MSEKNNENQVLIVDDSRVIRRAAVKILQKDFDVIEAEDGEEAWNELQKNTKISVVFSDLGMPNMDGFELLEKIRSAEDPAVARLPVIIITGAEESDGTKEEVLKLGATDFISKPFDSISLKSRAAANINYRREVQSLEKQLGVDKLTGLLIEKSFKKQAEQALAYARRHKHELSLICFDISQFTEIFLKHGKEIAEQILLKIVSIITDGKRIEDIAARLGVAQFALLLPSSDAQGAQMVAARVCQRISRLKLKIGKDELTIQCSAGVTSPATGELPDTFEQLLKQAEKALNAGLKRGGGKVVRYQSGASADKTVRQTSANASRKTIGKTSAKVNLIELLNKLQHKSGSVSDEQLGTAMRAIMPLLEKADSRLKLGLAKVISHLKKRLSD